MLIANHSYKLTACESWLFAEVCDSAPRTELFCWRRKSTLLKVWMLRSSKAFAICRTSIRTSTDPSPLPDVEVLAALDGGDRAHRDLVRAQAGLRIEAGDRELDRVAAAVDEEEDLAHPAVDAEPVQAVAEAQAKLKAAQAAYEAEVARSKKQ